MKDFKNIQEIKEELEIDKIKSLIENCLYFNATKEIIIDQLVKMCDISKKEAEEYLELYNEGEL